MRLIVALASALCLAAGPFACARSFPHPPYSAQPTSALVEVQAPAPPGRVEIVPARPSGAVWIDGEWTWRRARWAWTPGRWLIAPAGETFSPWVFVRSADGRLYFAPGVWRGARGAPIDPPPSLATAQVETTAVVDANGEAVITGRTLRPDRRKPTR
ncbi:MAG: hypothetical protein ACREJ3_13645 [Polyangiaceae bacterium]